MSTPDGLRIAFFGSSLLSSYWNGAATYYRGLIRALAERGHATTFYEPDAFGRQEHRDWDEAPDWADVVVYEPEEDAARRALEDARAADVVVKASGVGVLDEFLEREALELAAPGRPVCFWDVDAPATLERLDEDPDDAFHDLVPRYDVVFTYGGGEPVRRGYLEAGARACVPIYNALDPATHRPADADPELSGTLGFLGNRLPDREERVEEFFLSPARRLSDHRFLLGGSGWDERPLPDNVSWLGHVPTGRHNAFNSSPLAVLNINRGSMARYGHSPATRVFEAAGAAACLITDEFRGVERFLEPGREVLVASDGDAVVDLIRDLEPERARSVGEAARRRVLADHTYADRAARVEDRLEELVGGGHRWTS